MSEHKQQLLRSLPKVDEWILKLAPRCTAPLGLIKRVVRNEVERERQAILTAPDAARILSEDEWLARFAEALRQKSRPRFRPVINATGVVIHTNLGRSPLSKGAVLTLTEASKGYSNLEFDLATGRRGSRYSHVEDILRDLTGAEAALVVNNNAAAVLLALDTLAKGREVIVSRGQLVEIGGSFRIPEVMAKSGAKLVEVGATNRTHLADYQRAIGPETALLLKVHTSNFRIIGFTAEMSAAELASLAKNHGLLTMEDLGSGSLLDLSHYGLPPEPTVPEVVAAGVDVVCFSGDKLLGGPQAGIIVGKEAVLGQIKKNPLNRALRIDKLTLAALEATLRHYYQPEEALRHIPTLTMLTEDAAVIKKRATRLLRRLRPALDDHCRAELTPTRSKVGGGAMPEYHLPSFAIALTTDEKISLQQLEHDCRVLPVPVIGRIEHDRFLLDLRTVCDNEVNILARQLIVYFQERT